jgi:hypothetical protein
VSPLQQEKLHAVYMQCGCLGGCSMHSMCSLYTACIGSSTSRDQHHGCSCNVTLELHTWIFSVRKFVKPDSTPITPAAVSYSS